MLLQHDDRDDGVDYWAKRGRGRGTFQRGRGRFNFKKSGSSPKWTHDKYQGDGIVEDEEETIENNEEKDRRKEEKVNHSVNCRLDSSSCTVPSNTMHVQITLKILEFDY